MQIRGRHYLYPLHFEGQKSANFRPNFADFGTFKLYNFRLAQDIANLKQWLETTYICLLIFVQDIVNFSAVAAGNDALLELLGSRNKSATFCLLFPVPFIQNFTKFSWILHDTYPSHRIPPSVVNFCPLSSIWESCKWVGSSKMVQF